MSSDIMVNIAGERRLIWCTACNNQQDQWYESEPEQIEFMEMKVQVENDFFSGSLFRKTKFQPSGFSIHAISQYF